MELNNRELALVFWLAVVAIFCAVKAPDARRSVGPIIRTFFSPKILVPVLTLVLYSATFVWLAEKVGWWTPDLVVDTTVWFLTTAFVMLLNINKAMSEPGFFRRAALRTIEIPVVLAFVADLYPMSLPVEILLQGVLGLAAVLAVVAVRSADSGQRAVGRGAQGLLVVGGVILVTASLIQIVQFWSDVSLVSLAQKFTLPIWMTLILLPFVYVFALFAAYEKIYIRMRFLVPPGTSTSRARVALLMKARARLSRLAETKAQCLRRMILAPSLRQSLRAFDEEAS